MLNKDGERELAYVVKINDIKPIPGADRVELAVVNGWTVMVRKDQFKRGDLAVYFEIDSKVPEKEPFLFLAPKHYRVKTQKYFKGTVISQGLLMTAADFGWYTDFDNGEAVMIGKHEHRLGDFLTSELGITYAETEDNKRKGKPADKYKKMAGRHPKLFRSKPIQLLYKTSIGKRILFTFLGNRKDKSKAWPAWVTKTDEERIQNMPWILQDKREWIATEKLDGTSTTFTMKRGKLNWWDKMLHRKPKNEFYICSRNVVFDKPDQSCYYDSNVYLEMAEKYRVEAVLNDILAQHPEYDWVTIQGETYGYGIQKRMYHLYCHCFRAFNYITSTEGRWNSVKAAEMLKAYEINWVPIVDENFILPDTVDELLSAATGESAIDHKEREGLVFRSKDGNRSFKAVSNEYLMKYHG